MEYKDYYKTLGVSRNAPADEIRSAYRKLAMQYHPDRNPGDTAAEERFKEINEAYQVLSDAQKRARYDQLGSSYERWQRSGGAPGGFDWSQWYTGTGGTGGAQTIDDLFGGMGGGDVFSEFFRSIFGGAGGAGGMGGRPAGRRAPAYEQPVEISLAEAYSGATRQLQTASKRLSVRIPAGVKTGSKVRVPGGAPDGSDIYLRVQVTDDPRFERDGNDLNTTITVDVFTAMLGGEAEVPTMTGNVTLKIPPGTQPEQRIRLAGRGMPSVKDSQSRGDLFVRVKVSIPKNLDDRQKELIEKAAKLK